MQHARGPRLSTSSHSSTVALGNTLLNGLLPSRRTSQNQSAQQPRVVQSANNRLRTIQRTFITLGLTILFAFLLLITIELSKTLVDPRQYNNESHSSNSTSIRMVSFFGGVWLFNLILFFVCLIVHCLCYQQRLRRDRARAAFLREFGQIFDGGKSSSVNTLVDYLLKSCLLSFLWYSSCYLFIRSMTILDPFQIIVLYSITITLRQVLGWIFLHEEFIGNKIIAHILAQSALLSLAHNDGFRFNRFLLGLTMIVTAASMKTTFDVLVNGFVKDLKSHKHRIVMINVCLCGTCLFWPFALLFHVTAFEPIEIAHLGSLKPTITLLSALVLNVLLITLPLKYTSLANVASFLLVIPSIAVTDHYLMKINYPTLVICAILCACAGVLLSMIPKQWFQSAETVKMKQAFGLLNKDPNAGVAGLASPAGTAPGTSSAFEEIRAQRRIRNALLYNDVKT